MSLDSLPPELMLHIASFVGESGLNSLSQLRKNFTSKSLEQQLYYEDKKGAGKALKWGLDRGLVGTVMKAQQAGEDLDQTWLRGPDPAAARTPSPQASSITRPRYLTFVADRKKDWLLCTPLVRAISNGHQAVARYLLDEGVKSRGLTIYKTNYRNAYLQPIHHIILAAAEAKMQDLLLHVLQLGVGPNTPGMLDDDPCRLVTPLGLSLQPECPAEITEILLHYGANPTAPTGFWIWPDTVACQPFEQVWHQLLLEEGGAWMAGSDCAKKVCLLLNRIPNLNSVCVKDEPLLSLLCSHITPQRRELLSLVASRGHGLDPNVRSPLFRLMSNMLETDMGKSIRDLEKRIRYVSSAESMLQTLLRMGAEPNTPTEKQPPLDQLWFSKNDGPHWDRVFEMLVSYGAWLGDRMTGSQSRTPLHCVCIAEGPVNLNRLKRLLELGSPVNALDTGGDTALSLMQHRDEVEPHPSLKAGMEMLENHGAVRTKELSKVPVMVDMFSIGGSSMLL